MAEDDESVDSVDSVDSDDSDDSVDSDDSDDSDDRPSGSSSTATMPLTAVAIGSFALNRADAQTRWCWRRDQSLPTKHTPNSTRSSISGHMTHGSDGSDVGADSDGHLIMAPLVVGWGLLGPDRFIELCEASGFVADLTFAVLDRALRRLPGRSYLDRRFRNRLLVTDAPTKAAAPRNQDRPVVHRWNARPGRTTTSSPGRTNSRADRTGPALDRKGLLAWKRRRLTAEVGVTPRIGRLMGVASNHTVKPDADRVWDSTAFGPSRRSRSCFITSGLVRLRPSAGSAWGRYLGRLDIGVPVFFALSGFLLFRPIAAAVLDDRPLRPALVHLWRRGLRIYPAFWVALVLIVALTSEAFVDVTGAVTTFLLIHIHWPTHSVGPMPQVVEPGNRDQLLRGGCR